MQKKAILIGHNFNSILGLARALGTEGFEIGVIRTGKSRSSRLHSIGGSPEEKSKYISRYYNADSSNPKELISLLIRRFSSSEMKPVIFPVDDIAAEILDLNYENLNQYFYLPNVYNTQGKIIQLMDKGYQKQLAKKAGLPVPEGWTICISNGKYEIPSVITYPCFVKPETPILGRKNYMGKCDSITELKKILDTVSQKYKDCLMLVEEYINIEKEYGSVGMCNKDKVCIPGITEKTMVGHGSHTGVTACGKIHMFHEFKDTCEKMQLMMSMTGLQGLFDIDLYESNGVMYFNELNVRLGAEGVGTLIAGVNLAAMCAYSFLMPRTEIDYNAQPETITFANEKPLSSDYGEGYISWKQYKSAVQNADHCFIYDAEDKGPVWNFRVFLFKQRIRRLLSKLKRK